MKLAPPPSSWTARRRRTSSLPTTARWRWRLPLWTEIDAVRDRGCRAANRDAAKHHKHGAAARLEPNRKTACVASPRPQPRPASP
ncbi:hypothetical protein C2845_PM01G43480 [Panicum miliaceum]|uniref:Uncharacterized protein n=1 Tax=Panicum miliaceum TaxID=4540 RepID=A0A3L6TSX3_PANMI|nr:hypothetical protein C2845_PM01G43480 [Panicum miliaceum]